MILSITAGIVNDDEEWLLLLPVLLLYLSKLIYRGHSSTTVLVGLRAFCYYYRICLLLRSVNTLCTAFLNWSFERNPQ